MDHVADDAPHTVEELADYAGARRSWVAVDESDQPVGYVLLDVIDDNAHIEQMTVRPDHQGQGVARALLVQATGWARGTGRSAISLTTFADVPWNRPLYEHLGFCVLAEDEIGVELRALRDIEAAHGLDPALRVCMLLDVGPGGADIASSDPSGEDPDAADHLD